MGDFGWPFSPASEAKAGTTSELGAGLHNALGVSPCAVALSTSANACLGTQGIWATPVPLGFAVFGITLAFVLGVLLVLSTQALCCSCYVTGKVLWAGATALRQPTPLVAFAPAPVPGPLAIQDGGAAGKAEVVGFEARGRGVRQLRRGGGALA